MYASKSVRVFREYGPIMLVALAVALVSTVVAAFFQSLHQVGAEEVVAQETAAVPGPDGQQTMVVKEWGVKFVVPLADVMPTLKYARQSDSSVGLSTADLEKSGANCRAGRNGLGALVRVPAGSFETFAARTADVRFVQTVSNYDYGYMLPNNSCATAATEQIINRERSILTEALSSLAPVGN